MLHGKKWLILMGILVLLLSGCGKAEENADGKGRTVSTEVWTMGWDAEMAFRESGVVYEDAPIDFCDEVMEEILRDVIGKAEGEVYISDLQEIHALYLNGDGYWSNLQESRKNRFLFEEGKETWFSSVEDLKYCYNLQLLNFGWLENVKVPSLEALSDLPQLEKLLLQCLSLEEEVLESVGKLLGLKSIWFGKMPLTTIAPLQKLPQLEELSFEGTKVTEQVLKEIGTLLALERLRIGVYDPQLGTDWKGLTDGSFLLPIADQLTRLMARGGIDWNPEVLEKMENMKNLQIAYMNDLSFLSEMQTLERLDLYCCCSTDWRALSSVETLSHLDISGNMYTIVDVSAEDLKPMKQLEYLMLSFTKLSMEYSYQEIVDALPSLKGLRIR